MLTALLLAGALQQEPRAEVVRVTPAFASAAAPGCLNFLAVDPSDPNVLFGYSTAPGDLHRSDDGGLTWIDLAGPPQAIVSVVVSRIDPMRVFAVAGGFYVSEDRGETWTRSQSAPADLDGELVVDPFSSERLYVASNSFRGGTNVGEMWFSPDEGVHWLRKENGLPIGVPRSPVSRLLADPHSEGVFLVGLGEGLYETRDGGGHWELVSGEVLVPTGFDAASSDVVWGQNGDSLLLSTDGGATWEPRGVDCCPGVEHQTSLLRVVPDPISPGVAYILTEEQFAGFFFADHVLRTADYGASWDWFGAGVPSTLPGALRALVFDAEGRKMWITDCDGPAVYVFELRRARAVAPR